MKKSLLVITSAPWQQASRVQASACVGVSSLKGWTLDACCHALKFLSVSQEMQDVRLHVFCLTHESHNIGRPHLKIAI